MKPTQILSSEHRIIEVVITCLERMTERANAEGRLDGPAASDAVEFIRGFADHCHHGKEEARLFPMMIEKGFPSEGGPVAVMKSEHEQGRAFVRGMSDSITGAAQGETGELENFTKHARGYAALLRNHIIKEDNILFPMADRTLSEEDQQKLLDQFEKVEAEEIGEGVHEKYMEIAHSLARKYEVPFDEANAGAPGCHH